MLRACLIVRRMSRDYVARIITALHAHLCDDFGADTPLLFCDEVDEAAHNGATLVFVIGEGFGRFTRQPGCRYVYLNFSVVAVLGNPLAMSPRGWLLIRRKARLLLDKIDLFDAVMDYYPPQTRVLAGRLPVPVLPFLPWVPALPEERMIPMADRAHELCFVGGMSPRRRAVLDRLKAEGISLSPASGADLEDLAANAQLTLNLHLQRSNHFEIPRVVGALSVGSPVVTEDSHGIEDVVPRALVRAAPYAEVVDQVLQALRDPARLEDWAFLSRAWYERRYLPRCRDLFATSVREVPGLTSSGRGCLRMA